MSSNAKTQTAAKSSATAVNEKRAGTVDEKRLELWGEIFGDFVQYMPTPQGKAMFKRKLEEYKDQYRAFCKENNIEG